MNGSGLLVLIVPGFFVAFGLLWSAIVYSSARLSGWAALARHYPGTEPVTGQSWHWTSATFSWFASYRNVLTVKISPEGLFMRPLLPFRIGHESLLIPWSAIAGGQRTSLLLTQAFRLDVRDPSKGSTRPITFYGRGIVDALEEHLGK